MSGMFLKPLTIEEAVRMKSEYTGSLYLGGGTEINNPFSRSHGEVYISLEALNLKACVKGRNHYILGGSATFQELIDWDECYPPLREAALFLNSRNLRNQATLGGNLGAHLKDSYLVPILMVLDADVELGKGEILPLVTYIEEERRDLIINVRFSHNKGQAAVKNILRSAGGLSVLSVAVSLRTEKQKITKAAIAVSGLNHKIIRLSSVEEALVAGTVKPGTELEDAVKKAVITASDLCGSAEYKKQLCGVTVQDCVDRCLEASK
ncbi:FAD binding domain-containing protein [Oceanispirochaeta crateris]|nr:FAD binding domain-containing protein [Oceanispirochaeta crateris]